ncbi:hypothetical protein [Halobaculum sp. P14]|uniref:hypothetical protein n=1 Tax=Halobaculum sp. P14 TaxID=3421638 RepID=UPI003EBAFF0E
MPEEPSRADEWAESIQNTYQNRATASTGDALQDVADAVGDVVTPVQRPEWGPELGGERPPELSAEFAIRVGAEATPSTEFDVESVRTAANELFETLQLLATGVDAISAAGDAAAADAGSALFDGIRLLQLDVDRFEQTVVDSLPERLATAAKSTVDRIKDKVKRAVGSLWNTLFAHTTLDNWQVSGGIGTTLPGFTGNVTLALTFD